MACTNPGDDVSGSRLGYLVEDPGCGKYCLVSSNVWQPAHKSNLIHIKIALQIKPDLSTSFQLCITMTPTKGLQAMLKIENFQSVLIQPLMYIFEQIDKFPSLSAFLGNQ